MARKRHHYVPEAYLRSFCDSEGQICLYLKDNPKQVIRTTPDNICLRKLYYSQPIPGGGKDHNRLENLFSSLEAKWPGIVARLEQQQDANDCLADIFAFIALQRARVPAARDATEAILSAIATSTLRQLDAVGRLPAKPEGHSDILAHVVDAAVDPHQSIHAMVPMIQGAGEVLQRIGIGALHNKTDIPFLTSDNPVIWFDPSVAEEEMRPYTVRQDGPIVLLFPVTPRLMIYGHSSMREQFAQHGFGHGDLPKRSTVKVMNSRICQFAYEAMLAQEPGQDDLVCEHAGVSPVMRTQAIPCGSGVLLHFGYEWGKRRRKPKWEDQRTSHDTTRLERRARPDAL